MPPSAFAATAPRGGEPETDSSEQGDGRRHRLSSQSGRVSFSHADAVSDSGTGEDDGEAACGAGGGGGWEGSCMRHGGGSAAGGAANIQTSSAGATAPTPPKSAQQQEQQQAAQSGSAAQRASGSSPSLQLPRAAAAGSTEVRSPAREGARRRRLDPIAARPSHAGATICNASTSGGSSGATSPLAAARCKQTVPPLPADVYPQTYGAGRAAADAAAMATGAAAAVAAD
eukprot:260776-Chlamydomonas_euryale.AAC.1